MSPATLLRHLRALGPRVFLRRAWAVAPWLLLARAGKIAPWAAPALGLAAHGLRPREGRPLNAQCAREAMMRELIAAFAPAHIIETGTYRGATTEFFASFPSVSVWSCEVVRFYHHYAKRRLRGCANVHLSLGDSGAFLARTAADGVVTAKPCLFYLDAHWYDYLPLDAEIRTVKENWRDAVIVIDDFQVPGDAGYQFDDYGDTGRLCMDALGGGLCEGFDVYFPRLASALESGPKRGCVVLAGGAARPLVRDCLLLKPYAETTLAESPIPLSRAEPSHDEPIAHAQF